MSYFVSIFILIQVAFAQTEDELSFEANPALNYHGRFAHGGRQWPKLAPEMTAKIKPSASVYSSAALATGNQGLSLMPWNRWEERCERSSSDSQLQGRLLYLTSQVAAVEVDQPADFCGSYFNHGEDNRRVVFIKRGDLDGFYPRGEDQTEAGVIPPRCDGPECLSEDAQAILADLKKAAQGKRERCHKTEEELERYLRCHATPHQQDYDRYYKKLMDLAGSTFQAAYTPNQGVKAILKPEDSQVGGDTIPFLVGARSKVMKCIALRESRWDPTVRSNSQSGRGGAVGLAQHTEVNVNHINCMINGCSREVNGKIEKVKPTRWARDLWDEYFRRVDRTLSPAEKKKLFTNPVTGQPCGRDFSNKQRDAPCPVNAIAAMAIYQVEAELTIRRNSPLYRDSKHQDFNEDERCHLEVVQGSTNNGGTGTTRAAVRASNDTAAWSRHLREGTGDPNDHGVETENFALYLNNCLGANNWQPMYPLKPGEKPKDCSDK